MDNFIASALCLILLIIMLLIIDAFIMLLAVVVGASIGVGADAIIPGAGVYVMWPIWACYIISTAHMNFSMLADAYSKFRW